MKKVKFMLIALLAMFGFNSAMAAELIGSTQYTNDGYQYKILTMDKTTADKWVGTVSVSQSNWVNKAADKTTITINPTITINVKGEIGTGDTQVSVDAEVVFDIVEIEEGAFANLSDITKINFANGCKIKVIGEGAFAGTKIANLDLTNTKVEVLNKLFEDANVSLTSVTLPASLVSVAASALNHCFALATINADACVNLKTLGEFCFGDNVVESLDLSKTKVKTLENRPFVGGIYVDGAEVQASGLMNKTLKTLILPSTVNVAAQGLANLYNLESVNLEDTKIQAVSEEAFANDRALTSLTFPGTLKYMRKAGAFLGCASLATLNICYDNLLEVGVAEEGDLFEEAAAVDGTLSALKTLKFFTNDPTQYAFKAKVNRNAFWNCLGITSVDFASDGVIAATAELGQRAITLSNEENSTVTFGKLAVALPAGFIDGPIATGVEATVTFGEAVAQTAITAIVSGNLATVTFGKLTGSLMVEAIGAASKIVFGGDIVAPLTVAGDRVVNTRLTEIDFGAVKIAYTAGGEEVDEAFGIPAAAFDEVYAPNLVKVTWNPADDDAVEAFAQAAFGTEPKEGAAKVELYTTTAVGTIYDFNEANLWNVIFKATAADAKPVAIKVYGPADAVVYVGYFNNATESNYYIEKKQGNAVITVYSAFVDDSDNKIYMDPLMIVDGKFVVDAGQTVIVRSTTGDDVLAYATDDEGTMRYDAYIDDESDPVDPEPVPEPEPAPYIVKTPINALQFTSTAISADELGTRYYDQGQFVYYLQNPKTATGINFAILGTNQYLFANAVYIVKKGATQNGRLDVVWLDEGEATAIQNVKTTVESNAIYNLAGQKVDAAYKGIVIMNGKKMIQK